MKNHFLPFLWVHGESEERYRHMIGVIQDANIDAFCVEARPHPHFCEEQWWKDMEIILDEAEKRGMKVWILDDKHFPTGFAAGKVKDVQLNLRRRAITHSSRKVKTGQKVQLDAVKAAVPKEHYGMWGMILQLTASDGLKTMREKVGPEEILSCVAYSKNRRIDLMPYIKNSKLAWTVPDGDWTIELCGLTYHSGFHRNYINMMDERSCRIQIDAVYEPHYAHFKDKFGTVIAGFFSDEPELGNGNYVKQYNILGQTKDPLPYSDPLAERLEAALGADWKLLLPMLWSNEYDKKETARVRYLYMDAVTRLVEECFSRQIGTWCRNHGVEYIGHCIEDNNQHARTGTSLGHYFRGLKWQSMAGIDDIGGQVQPDGENIWKKNLFGNMDDGEFYQFALGKLGSSLGILNPNMEGRTMCEVFGNYGWAEGVQLEKYLLDHFMVRGVNYYVPHAFTCKDYPDRDCPPHFYAQGHNPQYRHFGKLMKYGQRICNLISEGTVEEQIAILYHGEAEWTGKCMMMQRPARVLMENQIDYVFMPSDVFEEREFYKTKISKTLEINGMQHKLVIVPYAQFINKACAEGLAEFLKAGGRVVFLENYPDGIATGEPMLGELKKADVVKLSGLLAYVEKLNLRDAVLTPSNTQIRILHYKSAQEIYYLVNESSQPYQGKVYLPGWTQCLAYDAWNNQIYIPEYTANDGIEVCITLESHKSVILVNSNPEAEIKALQDEFGIDTVQKTVAQKISEAPKNAKKSLTEFNRSVCKNISYPTFEKKEHIHKLDGYELTDKKFSGIIRYETSFNVKEERQVLLEITEAYEGVEVFVNGISAGIQIVPSYLYDLTPLCKEGKNELAIEVSTTLERENGGRNCHSGITGEVNLYRY